MYNQEKKYLTDAYQRMTDEILTKHIIEMNSGKSKPNVYYNTEIVGEIISFRNIQNTIAANILWYEDSKSKHSFVSTDCYANIFKILKEV